MNALALSALILGALIITSLAVAVGLLVWQESKPLRIKLKGLKTRGSENQDQDQQDGQDGEEQDA